MLRYFFSKQFIGFIAVGLIAAIINWLSRFVFNFWLPFNYAVICAYCIGMSVAFILNSIFIFSKSIRTKKTQAINFAFTNMTFLPLVLFSSIGLNNLLKISGIGHYSEALSHAIALTLPMFASFIIYKFWVFKEGYNGK